MLAVSSGAELPLVLPVPTSNVLPFTCQTYWLKLVVLNVARVLVCFIFLFTFVTLFVHSLLMTVSQIGLLTICTWGFNTLVNWGRSVSCGVFSQPVFGEILLLPLVVVTGIFFFKQKLF